jgi:hypothetical protein
MEEKLAEMVALENGLTLGFYDASKHVAGDRWLVAMVASIEVKVLPKYFKNEEAADTLLDDIRAVVGDKAVYRHEKIRNFIAETEKDKVFNALKERFLDANSKYLSSPEFPRKFILKKYQEAHGQSVKWKG